MYEELFYARLTALRQAKGVSAREMGLALGQSEDISTQLKTKRGSPRWRRFFISANIWA